MTKTQQKRKDYKKYIQITGKKNINKRNKPEGKTDIEGNEGRKQIKEGRKEKHIQLWISQMKWNCYRLLIGRANVEI